MSNQRLTPPHAPPPVFAHLVVISMPAWLFGSACVVDLSSGDVAPSPRSCAEAEHAAARLGEQLARREMHRAAGRKELVRLLEFGRQMDRWIDAELEPLSDHDVEAIAAGRGAGKAAGHYLLARCAHAFGLSVATTRRALKLWQTRKAGRLTSRDLFGVVRGTEVIEEAVTLETAEEIAGIRHPETGQYLPWFAEGGRQGAGTGGGA